MEIDSLPVASHAHGHVTNHNHHTHNARNYRPTSLPGPANPYYNPPVQIRQHAHPNATPSSSSRPSAKTGSKRRAEEDLNDSRLAKRFHLLDINQPAASLWAAPTAGMTASEPAAFSLHPLQTTPPTSSVRPPIYSTDGEPMSLDSTPYKSYIPSLDAELAEAEASETFNDQLIFIPEIERHLARISYSLLTAETTDERRKEFEALGGAAAIEQIERERERRREVEGRELVLASDGERTVSGVPQEKDWGRKAILESRRRRRELEEGNRLDECMQMGKEVESGFFGGDAEVRDEDDDGDAMDIG